MAARLLAGLALGLTLGGGALWWWLAAGERAPSAAAPSRAIGPEWALEPREAHPDRRNGGQREVRPAAPTTAEPQVEAAPREAAPFGAWEPPRDAPEFEGPVVETWFEAGRPEFQGTQVLDADGTWKLDGLWYAWHANGTPMERGAYARGLEDGPWEWWYEDGTPMARGTWVEGRRIGRWTFWQENGALGAIGHYVDGVGDGPWTLYHENGLRRTSGELVQGVPHGLWQVWNEDGTLDSERTGTWEHGRLRTD